MLLRNVHFQKALGPGHVIVMWTNKYKYGLGIILQENTKKNNDHTHTVLMLCNRDDESENGATSLVNFDPDHVIPFEAMTEMFKPEGEVGHIVAEVKGHIIIAVTKNVISVDSRRIINDYSQRQLPRFKSVM